MLGKGHGQHNQHCQCGVCRGNNMRDEGSEQKLFRLVGRFNIRAAKDAQKHGYLAEFSPKLVQAIETMPEVARLWEAV